MLVDTGSSVTIINPKLFEEIDPNRELNLIETDIKLKSANGHDIPVLGKCPFSLKLGNKVFPYIFITALTESNIFVTIILLAYTSRNPGF